jgi:hypothetical protein
LSLACDPPRPARPVGPRAAGGITLHSWFDLPDDPRARELSGIGWDDASRTLFAVQDETPHIVPLHADADLRTWRYGERIKVESEPLDLEGIVVLPDGFVVCSEIGPRILEVDRAGHFRREIALPAKFSEATKNKSLESLAMSPDARYLFTTSEAGLPRDGPHVRILRIDRTTGEYVEHAYAEDRLVRPDQDYGIADLAALSSEDLLVLERGWTKGIGNSVRIYRVNLADTASVCGAVERLGDLAVLPKTLFLDLATVPVPPGLPPVKQPQASPLLDNFEGLTIGPRLADGRRALFLVSDDNARSDQFARVLVLAFG